MPYFLDMPLESVMRTQLAMRHLKPDPVEDELLLHLVDLPCGAKSDVGRPSSRLGHHSDDRANVEQLEIESYFGPAIRLDPSLCFAPALLRRKE